LSIAAQSGFEEPFLTTFATVRSGEPELHHAIRRLRKRDEGMSLRFNLRLQRRALTRIRRAVFAAGFTRSFRTGIAWL
jgi:hypothetical protein